MLAGEAYCQQLFELRPKWVVSEYWSQEAGWSKFRPWAQRAAGIGQQNSLEVKVVRKQDLVVVFRCVRRQCKVEYGAGTVGWVPL